MLTTDLIDLVVDKAYATAVCDFKVKPTTDNWNKLSGAMLVVQQWSLFRNDGGLFADLADLPVHKWPETIVAYSCDGRSIAQVLAEKP